MELDSRRLTRLPVNEGPTSISISDSWRKTGGIRSRQPDSLGLLAALAVILGFVLEGHLLGSRRALAEAH